MPTKQPQDRKRKADPVDRLKAEAASLPGLDEMAGITISVSGRNGTATVTTLDNPLDWDAEVMGLLSAGDYFGAICGMVSPTDEAALRTVRPSIGSLMAALMEPAESGEASPGESQAS